MAFSVLVYHRFELHPYQSSLMVDLAPNGEVETSPKVRSSSREPQGTIHALWVQWFWFYLSFVSFAATLDHI